MKRSKFNMEDPELRSVTFKLNPDFSQSGGGINLDVSDAIDIERLDDNNAFVNYAIRVFDEDFSSDKPFFIEVVYGAMFNWNEMSENQVKSLLENNAPAILLGYIRPMVSMLSGNAGFPPLHLPLFNLQGKRSE